MSQLVFDDDLANQSRSCTAPATCCAGGGWSARRWGPPPASGSLTSAADQVSTSPSCSPRSGRPGRWSGSTPARRPSRLPRRRTQGQDNVALHQADATALPVADASFDRALSVQVLEYVSDLAAALAELHRALRPGGRLVVWDVDWVDPRPGTRPIPTGCAACWPFGTATSPTRACREPSPHGCVRRGSATSAPMATPSPARSSPPTAMAQRSFR